jgi:hypothetical protein
MKRLAAGLCVAIMLISTAALAKPVSDGWGGRGRTQHVRVDRSQQGMRYRRNRNRYHHRHRYVRPQRRRRHARYRPHRFN